MAGAFRMDDLRRFELLWKAVGGPPLEREYQREIWFSYKLAGGRPTQGEKRVRKEISFRYL